jgi:hypothetical protein
MGEIRVVIDDVLTNWVDVSTVEDDPNDPKVIPGSWEPVLRMVGVGISREEAIEYESQRQVFRLVPVEEAANG